MKSIDKKNKKTLLLVIHALNVGGGERVLCELVKKIDPMYFEVKVLVVGARIENSFANTVEQQADVQYLGITGRVTLKKIVKVCRTISKYNPDIVHSHLGGNVYSLLWALFTKGKLLITAHTIPSKAFHGYTETLVRLALKLNRLTLVAVSEENHTEMKRYFGADDHKCRCVNNGIDEDVFRREPHSGFGYINVARQDDNKNQALILRCFKKVHLLHPEAKLFLLGDGPNHQTLLRLKEELQLGDEALILGNIDDPSFYYAISDCYLQSSHREALPMSVIEAMAAHLPIVSTDVGGMRDIVNGNGYLVPDGDEEAYYQAMIDMIELQKEEFESFSEKSKEIIHGAYSSVAMARNYERIYCSI